MFVGIANTPRDYAWGSVSAISDLLGTTGSGGREAELWLGSHHGSPARILEPSQVGGARDLAEWIAAEPSTALGSHPQLPFLLKVLAAESPLSLQAHPSAEQAQDGFERENSLGVRLDAPQRNYKDPYPKPEIIYALSDRFEALCGFRPVEETVALLRALGIDDLASRLQASALPDVFEWLITRGDGVAALIDRVVTLAAAAPDADAGAPTAPDADAGAAPAPPAGATKTKEIGPETAAASTDTADSTRNSFVLGTTAALATVHTLAAGYPGDPGIVVSLLLNRVTLRRGQALYLPAGSIHAYLSGVGIEVMTASDNVLRGGLTSKHVDIGELLRVLDFTPTPVPYIQPLPGDGSAAVFSPHGPGFVLLHVAGDAAHRLTGPAIALCIDGRISIAGKAGTAVLTQGDAVYITPDEASLTFTGGGELFLATTS